MSKLTKTKKSKKKLSRFQKLWDQAAKLRRENERFRERLDNLVQRMQQEVLPAEHRAAVEHIPLLKRLLVLGQRKSLTRWERHELSEWIRELMDPIMVSGQLEAELEDAICRYQAYTMGLELADNSDQSPTEQLHSHLQQQQAELADAFAPESPDDRRARIESEVEIELDRKIGRAPQAPGDTAEDFDLFGDELFAAKQQAYDEYQQQRAEMREQLIEERMAKSQNESDDPFGFSNPFTDNDWEDGDNSDPFANPENNTPTISNEVFTRLFRTTVATLHPDRVIDKAQQEINHQLMSKLLKARKQGDVMTLINMYQEYVGDAEGLTGKDEKQLIKMLERQIDQLKEEKDEYGFSSPLHSAAYENFYFSTAKKTEISFRKHIDHIKESARHAQELANTITSLKTLKPYLEMRYDHFDPEIVFDELLDEFIRYG